MLLVRGRKMLTDITIKKLKPVNGKTKRLKDRDGLSIEARASGSKVFIFRFQWEKKPQTITIGKYPNISLLQARATATEYRSFLINNIDPRKKENEEQNLLTFQHIAERWLQKNQHNWKDVTYKKHSNSLKRDILPIIGNKDVNTITKNDILQIIQPHENKQHYEIAHRLHDKLKSIFEFAVGTSITSNFPFVGLKKVLAPKPAIKNQSAIKSNEAHSMLENINNSSANNIVKLYIEILAHLFTRPSELRLAKWDEFDLYQAEWHIPIDRMKMKAPHWVPLSPPVVNLLKQLKLITGFSPYLFNSPSSKKYQPISETSARKVLHNTGYKDRHTLHGFRSLSSSVLLEQSNFRSDAIEAQLAHKTQGVKGVYLRADFKLERRQLMEWYSDWLSYKNKLNNTEQRESL